MVHWHLFDAFHGSKKYMLPGTSSLLIRKLTGMYWPVDYLLNVLVVFFWEAVDGSRPGTSVVGIYFLGQLFPIMVTFYLDFFRQGKDLVLVLSCMLPLCLGRKFLSRWN